MGDTGVDDGLCETIPPGDCHAVSVSLPTWQSNLQWARKDEILVSRMRSGYPRFFVHSLIRELAQVLGDKHCPRGTERLPFSSVAAAERCCDWIAQQIPSKQVGTYSLYLDGEETAEKIFPKWLSTHLVWFKPEHWPLAKAYWQHAGEGISSRRAQACLNYIGSFAPSRTTVQDEMNGEHYNTDPAYIPDQFPREAAAYDAKRLIRAQIASYLDQSVTDLDSQRDVYLHLSGMKAIYDAFRAVLQIAPNSSDPPILVAYGFLYVDTFKIMSKLGSSTANLYGHGSTEELDQLENDLRGGKRICGLFTEFPTNPLLTCVDLRRIRRLADEYGFVVVCDDTVGTSVNLDIFQYVDLLVTSMTKMFSGACNVMGGSVVVNPNSRYYRELQIALGGIYEDLYYPEDAIVMAKNCVDFDVRVGKIDANAEAVASLLLKRTDLVKHVYYPSMERSKAVYDSFKRAGKGYGYLLSIEFTGPDFAIAFFDHLEVAKGPSLGTNFTLACPYTLLGHFGELDFAAEYGVMEHLVRISVGTEDDVMDRVNRALKATAIVDS